ncbi:MAG: ribosomal-processing cysteine protease Prp [Eubacteriaceae bacterium]
MIRCCFSRDNGDISSVEVEGHSNYADIGKDIVCAAVSSLVISSVNGLISHVGLDVEYEMNDDGFVKFEVPIIHEDKKRIQCNAILETLYLGVKSIELEYKEHIKVIG